MRTVHFVGFHSAPSATGRNDGTEQNCTGTEKAERCEGDMAEVRYGLEGRTFLNAVDETCPPVRSDFQNIFNKFQTPVTLKINRKIMSTNVNHLLRMPLFAASRCSSPPLRTRRGHSPESHYLTR